jgi:hypothetical protein
MGHRWLDRKAQDIWTFAHALNHNAGTKQHFADFVTVQNTKSAKGAKRVNLVLAKENTQMNTRTRYSIFGKQQL